MDTRGTSNRLRLLRSHGQSVWLDFIRRLLIESGELERMVSEDGLTGLTSNPTILEKAIESSDAYAHSLEELAGDPALTARDIYERLTVKDITDAADVLRTVYDRTEGADGFVSLEVSPDVANDTHATVAEAQRLWAAVDRRNVMIKVPGTLEGLPAIR